MKIDLVFDMSGKEGDGPPRAPYTRHRDDTSSENSAISKDEGAFYADIHGLNAAEHFRVAKEALEKAQPAGV